MRRKNLKYLLVIVLGAGIFAGFKYYEGNKKRETVINNMVHDALTQAHFSPKPINDELSKSVYKAYLESLDYGKKYLTQKDVDELKAFETQLDDQFKTNQLEFFDMSHVMIKKRMEETKKYYTDFLAKPFDFDKNEELETDNDKLEFAANTKELKERWRKTLKLRVLSRVYDKLEDNDSLDFETEEVKAREKELEYQNDLFEYMAEVDRIEWLGFYLNSFSAVFDPHTQYFAPKVKDKWEEEMTGQFEGIGAQLRVKGDYVTIEKIIAGSASWRQGELKAGDKILAVGQGSEEPVDVVGMKLDKVVKQIRGKKGTEVRLTVKKKDGSKEVIPIIRDIVELDQTFAKSAVLGEEENKVGYIRLPKFYVDFYSKENHNAAEDVKMEIERLKEENIEGLILDLRNNGGGSLKAAIDIAGLFIDKGPVVQVKNSFGTTRVHKDQDSRVYYDGPLIIMVNDFSASASEILAAAMQDYNRAIIVGSKTTFGKGTVQNIFDIDKAAGAAYNDVKPLGAVKITTEKFYRINGGTTQLNGVTPDIILPNIYNNLDMGEKEEDFAMPFDEIAPAKYQVFAQNDVMFNSAIAASKKRIGSNDHFNHVLDYAKWLKENEDKTTVPLNYEAYKEKQIKYEADLDAFELDKKKTDSISVGFLTIKPDWYATDTAKVEQFEKWHSNLSKDAYLVETLKIMYDLGDKMAAVKQDE